MLEQITNVNGDWNLKVAELRAALALASKALVNAVAFLDSDERYEPQEGVKRVMEILREHKAALSNPLVRAAAER